MAGLSSRNEGERLLERIDEKACWVHRGSQRIDTAQSDDRCDEEQKVIGVPASRMRNMFQKCSLRKDWNNGGVETIGQALDPGWAVTVALGRRDGLKSVREYTERRDLDLSSLVWTRGRDCPLEILQDRMRCPRCGSRRVRMLFTPPDGGSIRAA